MLRRHIGRRIAEAIHASGRSQNSIAKRIGVSSSTMSGWVSGRAQPSLETLGALCQILNVSSDAILGLDQQSREDKTIEIERSRLMDEMLKMLTLERLIRAHRRKFRSHAVPPDVIETHDENRKTLHRLEQELLKLEERHLPHLTMAALESQPHAKDDREPRKKRKG